MLFKQLEKFEHPNVVRYEIFPNNWEFKLDCQILSETDVLKNCSDLIRYSP